MSKIKGYQVAVTGVIPAGEQSCSLNIQNNVQEVDVKNATNPLSPPQEIVSAQWNIQQTQKLVDAATIKVLLQAALSDSDVEVSMSVDGDTSWTGNAFVSDVNIQAPNRGDIMANTTYSGNGAIVKETL